MNRSPIAIAALAITLLLLAPGAAWSGVTYKSVGAGLALPTGDLADAVDSGYTVRGQMGLGLLTFGDVHVQTGWTRFSSSTSGDDDVSTFHAGVGARVGTGATFIGANLVYFFGDDDGTGVLPEVGVVFGPLEGVLDYRLDGDAHWFGLRAGYRF